MRNRMAIESETGERRLLSVVVAIPSQFLYTFKTMTFSRLSFPVLLSGALLFASAHTAQADALFDFEANAPNTAAPFTDTVNGLSATFGGQASVCDSLGIFQSLSGHILIQNLCGPSTESGPLSVSFSANLTGIVFNFATAGGVGTVTLAAFENATSVGSMNFTSALPMGLLNGEGTASFFGTFNRVTLTGDTLLAMDNVSARTTAPVPEPAAFATVLAGMGLLATFARKQKR